MNRSTCRSGPMYRLLILILLLTLIIASGTYAEPESDSRLQEQQADGADDFVPGWFWFVGTSNYHLRLRTSEDQIDRMLNRPLGLLLPRWQEPTTFKDWSDDWRIWDLWAGIGRDINQHTSWSIYAGGGAGTIRNRSVYLPLTVDADFTRRSILAGSSITYYPFGKPSKLERGLRASLYGTRPMAEFNLGYTHQTVIGDVGLSMPLAGRIVRVYDKEQHHLFWVSPRLGIEIPISEKNSLNILGGYLFFHEQSDEFNGILLQAFIRRRF